MESFPLTIWNQSSVFSENEIYNFRSQLNPPLHLARESWEVALTEISYPTSRYLAVGDSEVKITSKTWLYPYGRDQGNYSFIYRPNIKIKGGYFYNYDKLMEHIHNTVLKAFLKFYEENPDHRDLILQYGLVPGFHWDQTNKQNRYVLGEIKPPIPSSITEFIHFSSIRIISGIQMWHSLGFRDFTLDKKFSFSYEAIAAPADTPEIFIDDYEGFFVIAPNLIDSTTVGFGASRAAILSYVPYLANQNRDIVTIRPKHPLYLHVIGGYINNLQIQIHDLQLKPIYFHSDRLKLVLHFKKK